MPAPSITRWNGQIKTPWRGGYTSLDQLAENSSECADAMDGCVFSLIWKNDNLMPFQFIRGFSMSPVTSWILYNPDGSVYRDLTAEIGKLRYDATNLAGSGASVQYVTYTGELLEAVLDPGLYYMQIVSGGVTYYWEPIRIVCKAYSANVFPVESFDEGIWADNNPDADWFISRYPNVAVAVINTGGQPTDPEWESQGNYVINTGTNSVYQYLSGSWVNDPTPATGAWYDRATGNFYRFFSGAWVGLVDPVTVADGKACWAGSFDVPIDFSLSSLPCPEEALRFEIIVTGWTTGTLTAETDDDESEVIAGNGTFSFTAYVANGYVLGLLPDAGFDGCVTVRAYCPLDMSDCFYRIDWSNCGNIGNTMLQNGFTNSMYFEQWEYPVRPEVKTTVRTQQRADGSLVTTARSRETRWQIGPLMVPWYVADALADMAMYDHIELRPVGGGADIITNVEVSVENEEDFAECLKTVTITFENERAAVACCDDFAPPCKEACTNAEGFTDDPDPVEDSIYLVSGASAWAVALSDGFSPQTACDSGIADITDHDVFVKTVYFDLNFGAWSDLALIAGVDVTIEEDETCLINIMAIIPEGYSAVLQYKNPDGDWVTDESYNLTEPGWLDNDYLRETPSDQDPSNTLRLMVYVDGIGLDGRPQSGRCIVGYSVEFTYACE